MNNVTNRFLKSIHIEEIDQFDLELTHYKKDLQGKWSYHFLKHSPWDIDSLEHFLASVQRYIDYKLDIIFSYSFTPQVSDALELFSSWFMRRHFIPCPFII